MYESVLKFENTYSKLDNTFYSKLDPVKVKKPELLIFNKRLSQELGINISVLKSQEIANLLSGNIILKSSDPIAQAYAGHQFGNFTILGDGRAILLGEYVTSKGKRYDIQLKGSGITPYSRNGDGRAALGPMLREYIISEAMFHLNIPTTRSLSVVKTGELVFRDEMLAGAILTRVASSHIRVGTFQFAIYKNNILLLNQLLEYTINRHFPLLKEADNKALELLRVVALKQIDLVVNWMRVGFIHGVMNTDNVSLCGETIDYGPCAFMNNYSPKTVFSSIDYSGRYSYFNQKYITQWNLARFAETLIPLLDKNKKKSLLLAQTEIEKLELIFERKWLEMMRKKLGLFGNFIEDENLIKGLFIWMEKRSIDFTNFFRTLKKKEIKMKEFFNDNEFTEWYKKWQIRLKKNKKDFKESLFLMENSNPEVIPRNHIVEMVLKEAYSENLKPLNDFLEVLSNPYTMTKDYQYYQLSPKNRDDKYQTFCGT